MFDDSMTRPVAETPRTLRTARNRLVQAQDRVGIDRPVAPLIESDRGLGADPKAVPRLLEDAASLHEAALDPVRWPAVVRAAHMTLESSRRSGEFSEEQATWLGTVVESAARLAAEVARLELAREAATLAVDAVEVGIVAVGAHGEVVRMNRRAEGLLSDSLLDRTDPAAGPPRRPCLNELLGLVAARDSGAGPTLAVVDMPGGAQLEMLAVPLAAPDQSSFTESRIILFLVELGTSEGPDESDLQAAFAFTRAEARMAARLVRGDTVQEAAAGLKIRIPTARTHLSRILQKTGTTRQSELMRVLLAVPHAAPNE